jgi:hypothetical protein
VGDVRIGLLAVASYRTSGELAIAAIAVKLRRGRPVYCVAGSRTWTASINAVAHEAVRAREERDANAR